MKIAVNISLVLLLLSGLVSSSCSVSRERDPEADFSSFRMWVNNKASQLASLTEQDWNNAKEDFRIRTNELDSRQNQLTDELKEEYKQLKQRFHDLDAEYSEQVVLASWRKELLGEYADLSRINSANVVAAYSHFMENVRERHKDWSEQLWDMTDKVFEELNARKAAMAAALSTEDEVQIKALQMEYTTLETKE